MAAAAVKVADRFARYVGFDVGIGLFNIVLHIKGVSRSFRYRNSVVKRKTGRNSTDSNYNSPRSVCSYLTSGVATLLIRDVNERRLESHGGDESDRCSHELTQPLHGEYSRHHGTTPSGGSELGDNDAGKRIVASDADTL